MFTWYKGLRGPKKSQTQSDFPPYKIYQNGNGRFEIRELNPKLGEYTYTLNAILAIEGCKTIAECHAAMADLKDRREREVYRQVWP
jgi:hypothetical protein